MTISKLTRKKGLGRAGGLRKSTNQRGLLASIVSLISAL